MQAKIKFEWNALTGNPSFHDQWFALYRDDGLIDDWTWINGVNRGDFRLHSVGGQGISFSAVLP
jgi:hypothetical protein